MSDVIDQLLERVGDQLYAKESKARGAGDYRLAHSYREAVEVMVKTARELGWKEAS